MKLTRAQRATLFVCPDWSAPFEVMMRRHETTGEIVCPRGLQNTLGRLRNLNLVEYGMCNDTYRITEAGRDLLSQEQSHER